MSAGPQAAVHARTIFMLEFIPSPCVSVTLHLFHALCNIQSPFVEFAFHKFAQIWHTVKSHDTNTCSGRLTAKSCFCASFVWSLKRTYTEAFTAVEESWLIK